MRFLYLSLIGLAPALFWGCGKSESTSSTSKKEIVYIPAIEEDFYPEVEKKGIAKKEKSKEKAVIINSEKPKEKIIEEEKEYIAPIEKKGTTKSTEEIVAELEYMWRGEEVAAEEEIEEEKPPLEKILLEKKNPDQKNTREKEKKLAIILQQLGKGETEDAKKEILEKGLSQMENSQENAEVLNELKEFLPSSLHESINTKIRIIKGGK